MIMPNFSQVVNRFRIAELQKRAVKFAENYDDSDDRRSIILVPGGMGSRLLQSTTVFQDGVDFPDVLQLKLREIWLSLAAFLQGDIAQLHMTPQGEDKDRKPIIASGELSSIIKEYDGTEKHFSSLANYATFGYDWRRLPEEEFMYLFEFLLRIRNEVKARGFEDPLPRLTLFGHSMGGLIIKLFTNYLVDSGEDTTKWFYRFVSAGTPFYGTLNHMSRYYVGDFLLNLFVRGGAVAVTSMTASMPGPYGLIPAPRDIIGPRLNQLGLNSYPVKDSDPSHSEIDTFGDEAAERFPDIMEPEYFDEAYAMFTAIDRDLPAVRDQIFHIRSNVSDETFPLEILWDKVQGEGFDPNSKDPVANNNGASDGSVPFWSARLATTPDNQIFDLRNAKHGSLAEHPRTLEIVEKLMYPGTLPPAGAQPPTADVEVADATEVIALINEVKAGNKPESDIIDAPLPIHRCLAYSLGLT
jgi:hypothetical protein